jgi:hypothetical protein
MSNNNRICKMPITAAEIKQLKDLLGIDQLPIAWTERDLDRLGIRSVYSLRRDRLEGGGIPYVKDKGRIAYPVIEVLRWMKTNLKTNVARRSP